MRHHIADNRFSSRLHLSLFSLKKDLEHFIYFWPLFAAPMTLHQTLDQCKYLELSFTLGIRNCDQAREKNNVF